MQTTSRPSDEDEPDKIPLDRLDAGPAGVSLYRALDHHYADTGSVSKLYRLRVACLLVFSAVFCWSVYTSFMHNDPWETSKCRMAYMSPGYLRLDGLNASHSRMAGKYSLWLYREQGWDLSNKVSLSPSFGRGYVSYWSFLFRSPTAYQFYLPQATQDPIAKSAASQLQLQDNTTRVRVDLMSVVFPLANRSWTFSQASVCGIPLNFEG